MKRNNVAHRARRTARILAAIATAVTFSVVASSAITAEDTRAAWLDTEYVSAPLGTLDCAVNSDQFSSRASGKLLSGQALGINLDTIANVRGVDVQNTGTALIVDPAPPIADPAGDDTFVNALDVEALRAINLSLGNVLALPVNTDLGVVNHYAQARDNGVSTGAAGAVNNTGGIQLTPVAPGSQQPTLATVKLGQLLSSITGNGIGGGIANLADASLEVGAVSSVATLNACNSEWSGNIYDNLARNYLVSALRLNVNTPLVAGLVTSTQGVLNGVEATVEALAGNTGILSSLTSAVSGLLGPLELVRLGTVSITDLNATLDLSTVNALLDDTIRDTKNIVAIDLARGTVAIDLAGLLGSVYGTTGVNGLPPNTQLLINAAVVNALNLAVTEALNKWVSDITSALSLALRALTLSAKVNVSLLPLIGDTPVAAIALTIPPTSLNNLVAGNVAITASTSLLGAQCVPVIPPLPGFPPLPLTPACILNGVVNGLVTPLVNGLGQSLGIILRNAIVGVPPATNGGLLPAITGALTDLTAPLISFVGLTTRALFGENSVLSLSVNAQNRPNPALASGTAVPRWAASLPGPDAAARSTGRYDVSALRISTLGILGPNLAVDIDLARSSVGSNSVIR